MKVVMVMFDSLNRHFLPPYGCDWTHAPNFARLARRAVTFDRSYVCSMPCMPARRDLHTGRPGFLHRGWGPLEPFDDGFVARLRGAGVHTHLTTDHQHYFEPGGATYHTQYSSWRFFRGQEGDPFFGQVRDPVVPPHRNAPHIAPRLLRGDFVNRQLIRHEDQMPQSRTFREGIDFIERNAGEESWFLQIETFDPHEPFHAPRRFQDLYPDSYDGPLFDWPAYAPVSETPEEVEHMRRRYAALLSMCDAHLGDVLDAFDRHDLWQDTMLIVWTDHGFLLGEHGCWAKNWMPIYEPISHTPFWVHDPRHPECDGQRRGALVQPAIDLAPTILNALGVPGAAAIRGHDLEVVIESDASVREAAIFGYFGDRLNVTDGRFVLYDVPACPATPLHEYTLMPLYMHDFFAPHLLREAQLHPGTAWSADLPVLRVPVKGQGAREADGTVRSLLFDLENDPGQEQPLDDSATRGRLRDLAQSLMRFYDAPPEVHERFAV